MKYLLRLLCGNIRSFDMTIKDQTNQVINDLNIQINNNMDTFCVMGRQLKYKLIKTDLKRYLDSFTKICFWFFDVLVG